MSECAKIEYLIRNHRWPTYFCVHDFLPRRKLPRCICSSSCRHLHCQQAIAKVKKCCKVFISRRAEVNIDVRSCELRIMLMWCIHEYPLYGQYTPLDMVRFGCALFYCNIIICYQRTREIFKSLCLGFTMTSSNGNIFRITGHLCGEFIGSRWIPRTKASDAELCCFLWSASE